MGVGVCEVGALTPGSSPRCQPDGHKNPAGGALHMPSNHPLPCLPPFLGPSTTPTASYSMAGPRQQHAAAPPPPPPLVALTCTAQRRPADAGPAWWAPMAPGMRLPRPRGDPPWQLSRWPAPLPPRRLRGRRRGSRGGHRLMLPSCCHRLDMDSVHSAKASLTRLHCVQAWLRLLATLPTPTHLCQPLPARLRRQQAPARTQPGSAGG